MHRSTHRRCEPRGIAPGFHHQIERHSIFRLFVRQVPRRAINAEVKSIFFHILDDADNCQPRKILLPRSHAFDALADGIFAGPSLPRQFLADDHHRQTFRAVVRVQQTAAAQRDVAHHIGARQHALPKLGGELFGRRLIAQHEAALGRGASQHEPARARARQGQSDDKAGPQSGYRRPPEPRAHEYRLGEPRDQRGDRGHLEEGR